MNDSLDDLMDLEKLDVNLFRSRYHKENFRQSLFGGQILGQALMAVSATVENILPSSLHAYFLRAGSSDAPVIYDVESVRDGNTISTRRVVARQHGRPIFNMSASFHKHEEGFEHQQEIPLDIPSPEEILEKNLKEQPQMPVPFILLPVDEDLFTYKGSRKAEAYFWLKTSEPVGASKLVHLSTLAFASDIGLLATSLLPHSKRLDDQNLFVASIDHAMWFHSNDFEPNDWMLYKTVSPWTGKARGFNIGSIFNRDKKLIASTTQEGLIRPSEQLLTEIKGI